MSLTHKISLEISSPGLSWQLHRVFNDSGSLLSAAQFLAYCPCHQAYKVASRALAVTPTFQTGQATSL